MAAIFGDAIRMELSVMFDFTWPFYVRSIDAGRTTGGIIVIARDPVRVSSSGRFYPNLNSEAVRAMFIVLSYSYGFTLRFT